MPETSDTTRPPRSPPPLPRTGRRSLLLATAAVIALAGAVTLFAFEPAAAGVFPPCPFHKVTGLFCPGCGSTRAAHHLLHGRLATAFGFNPLVVISVPFVAVALVREARRWVRADAPAPRRSPLPHWWVWALLAVVLAFVVLRNLPWKPVRWMAP